MTRHLLTVTALAFVFVFSGVSTAEAQNARVTRSERHDTTPRPLRDIARDARPAPVGLAPFAVPNKIMRVNGAPRPQFDAVVDPVVQNSAGALAPSIFQNFEGSSDDDNSAILGFRVVPPDTDGDVGPNHYFQWINSIIQIFDKNGNSLVGPIAGNTIFSGFGGLCETTNDGDPIVLYDEGADRWLASQFALDFTANTYSMCVAISTTGDPTGTYNRYEFSFANDFPDYPKLGIWDDSYTMTTRNFTNAASWNGVWAHAMDRTAMLNGAPASIVSFSFPTNFLIDGYLPADADNAVSGPAVFGGHGSDGNTTFELFELDVDWTNPGAASLTQIAGVGVSSFTESGFSSVVNQPNGQLLDALGGFTMHRLNVRDFGTHRSMVTNHTVDVSTGVQGIRWYEFRNTGGNWFLHQEGTYSPDSDDRWMGSISINANGDISLGYSRSSSSMFPSIYMTGQTADQSGTGVMNVAETLIQAGAGSQSGASRWGDYSMMSVDPNDNTTFWYTTEYYAETNSFDFKTRIASFQLEEGGGGNNPPNASFTSSCTLLMCDFTDTSTDSDGSIVSWSWDFGDSGTSTAQNPSHSYAANGTYTVMLTVTDDMGATDSASGDVTVSDGTGPATMHVEDIVTAVVKITGGRAGQATVTVNDENGAPVSGATVTGTFSGDLNGSAEAVTDGNGEALVQLVATGLNRNSTVNFCVDDVTDTLTYDPDANADPSFDCGEPPQPGLFMHIENIVTSVVRITGGRAGQATVTINDENGAPVSGATVLGTFSGDLNGSASAVTTSSGIAVVQLVGTGLNKNSVINFCVDDLTGSLTYDPDANANPAFDCATAAPSKGGVASSETPDAFGLDQNYPNPFNPATIITYSLAEGSPVTLKVYNVLGKEVATLVDGYQEAGAHRVGFDASRLSAGVYLYVIHAGSYTQSRRMTLLK